MNPRTKLLDWFRRRVGKAGAWMLRKAYGERVMSELIGNWGGTASPAAWSANRIEQVQHYKHWVYRSINTIAMLATKELPSIVRVVSNDEASAYKSRFKAWQSGQGERPEPRRFLTESEKRGLLRGKSLQTVQSDESLEYLDDTDPLVRILKDPNGPDTGSDLFIETLLFLELTGNSYWYIVPKKNAPGVAEIWVMPSHWVYPQHTGNSGNIVDYYDVRPWGQSGTAKPMRFEADEFIHFKYKSPLSKVDGTSPLQAAAEIVDTYESVQLCRYFQNKNGAHVGTTIQMDAAVDIDDATLKRFEAKWLANFQGEYGFNRPKILPPGASLVHPLGDRELAMIQSSDQMRDYVIGMWGLTKSVLGFMEDANRASFEAALAQCFYLVVNPRLSIISQVLTEKLCPLFGENLRVYWRDMTPADRATELQEWTLLLNKGMHKPNEFRQWMNLEPLPGGDDIVEPMGSVPAGMGFDSLGGFGGAGTGTGADIADQIRDSVGAEDSEKRFTVKAIVEPEPEPSPMPAVLTELTRISDALGRPAPQPSITFSGPTGRSVSVKVHRGEDGKLCGLDVIEENK